MINDLSYRLEEWSWDGFSGISMIEDLRDSSPNKYSINEQAVINFIQSNFGVAAYDLQIKVSTPFKFYNFARQ